MKLFGNVIQAMAEYHCETTNQQMVKKTIKIGKERHLPALHQKTRFFDRVCKVAAEVYAEEHNLEFTSAHPSQNTL